MYRFNGSGDDQWEEIHNAHKSSDNNLQVTKKRISWHKYPRFPCSKTIVLLSLCGKAQIARRGAESNQNFRSSIYASGDPIISYQIQISLASLIIQCY